MTRRRLATLGVLLIFGCAALALFRARPVEIFDAYTEARLRLSGAESHTTTVRGATVHYYVMGPAQGPPVVLVHGLGGRSEDWRNLAPHLTEAGFRVYLPDLLGYGRSDKPGDFSYSIADEAEVVVGFLDALSLKQVDLGGWSMGGWIVQRIAAEHPERVHKLMLFDSAGLFVKPAWDTALFTPESATELAKLDDLLTPHAPNLPDFVVRDILRASRQDAWVIHRALASMLTGRDTTDTLLPQLKMPVLLVWGEADQITPISEGKTMQALIPKAQLRVIQGCGHLAPSLCAGQVGPHVVAFLR
jgi:pimeloyl-ACP methyl ester carboxylesterase